MYTNVNNILRPCDPAADRDLASDTYVDSKHIYTYIYVYIHVCIYMYAYVCN